MGRLSSKLGPTRPEGTDVVSTGESGGTKFLREDGDGTSSWQVAGITVQQVNTPYGEVATGTTTMALDDTIPQSSEGTEFLTASITPKSVSNKLRIDVVVNVSINSADKWPIVALFQDSTADALASSMKENLTNNELTPIPFTYWMDAGTTSSTTFKVRAGPNSAATITLNGIASSRYMGGTLVSSLTITEYAA